jgi:hypothetical protein
MYRVREWERVREKDDELWVLLVKLNFELWSLLL